MNIISCIILLCVCFKHMDAFNGSYEREYSHGMLPQRRVEVPVKKFPHVAYISYEDEAAFCAGAIIDRRIILTAGQCITTLDGKPLDVEYMDIYVGSNTPMQGINYKVCAVLPHEQYYPINTRHPNYSYDVGLILLTKNIAFNSYIRKAPMTPLNTWKKKRDTLTLPSVGYVEENGEIYEKLKTTMLVHVNEPGCDNLFESQAENYSERMICLMSISGNCDSDPGAAIMWKGFIVGIANLKRGEECMEGIAASMYVDVTYFHRWIKTSSKMLKKKNKCKA